MPENYSTHSPEHETTPAPAKGQSIEVGFLRAALLHAGLLSPSMNPGALKEALKEEPAMSLREAMGRALMAAWPEIYDNEGDDSADWEEIAGREADEFLDALAFVLTPSCAKPN